MARPPKQVDAEVVRKLAQIHCTTEEIASVCGVSKDTIERRFMDILQDGRAKGRASLRRLQWDAAQKGNITMMIWLGKQLLDQRDKRDENVSVESRNSGAILEEFKKVLDDSGNGREVSGQIAGKVKNKG